MHTPTPPNITVDPELAVFNILDVAADMTIALLMIFHPGVDHPESERDRDHYLANRIIQDAHRLRRSLTSYQHHLELGDSDSDFPF